MPWSCQERRDGRGSRTRGGKGCGYAVVLSLCHSVGYCGVIKKRMRVCLTSIAYGLDSPNVRKAKGVAFEKGLVALGVELPANLHNRKLMEGVGEVDDVCSSGECGFKDGIAQLSRQSREASEGPWTFKISCGRLLITEKLRPRDIDDERGDETAGPS